MAETEPLGYRPALDGLRGVAVLAVVAVHTGADWAVSGDVGVHFFFVLSGFLITRLLLEERAAGGFDLRAFWMRRAARLLPAALLVVAVSVLWAWAVEDRATIAMAPSVVAYIANWYRQTAESAGVLGHMWSLAVEEQFYVLWPLVFGLLPMRRRVGWWLIVGSLVGSLAWRIGTFDGASAAMFWRTDYNLDLLLVGAGLAFVWRSWRPPTALVWASGIALVWVPGATPLTWEVVTATWVAVASAVIICAALAAPARLLSWGPLVEVGRMSYSIYLWHILALAVAASLGTPVGFGVALGLAMARVSYVFVEAPVRSWARRKLATSDASQSENMDDKLLVLGE